MVVTLLSQILSLVAVVLAAMLLRRFTRIDLPLACILCGFVFGQLLGVIEFDTGIRAHNLADVIFYLILPVLILQAAWRIDAAVFRRWLVPALLLATLGVLAGTIVTAALMYRGIDHAGGFPWIAALMTAAVVAATDPGSVVDQLRDRDTASGLATLFEGESLFNDASAVVLFMLALALALEPGGSSANPLFSFLWVFIAGVLIGLASGWLTAAAVRALASDSSATILLLFSAFTTYYLTEELAGASGILAVLAATLLTRRLLAGRLPEGSGPDTDGPLNNTLTWAGELFNCLLYVITGLVVTLGMFSSHWLAMLIAIGAALAGRICAVSICAALLLPFPGRIPFGWQLLMVWGGTRGVIALALALSLPVELDYWYTVQCMVFGVVLFSLLVQGSTSRLLIARFGGDSTPPR